MNSKIGKLWHKFNLTGIKDNPVISDRELDVLLSEIDELILLFEDLNDSTHAYVWRLHRDSVKRLIFSRSW